MHDVSPFDTEEDLIKAIKRIFEGNDKTKTGGAFHKIIEDGPEYGLSYKTKAGVQVSGQLVDGIFFTDDQARPAIEYRNSHPDMVHELPISRIYHAATGDIMVTGRIDGIEGKEIRDPKTKYRSPDFQEYSDSFQWRFYLDMIGLDIFYYDVFEVIGFDTLSQPQPHFLPDVIIYDPLAHKCIRYDRMHDDCLQLINSFFEYIDNRNFYHLLKQPTNEPSFF